VKAAFASLGVLAFAVWAFAVVQYVMLLSRRREDVTLWSLLTRGIRAFDPQWFAAEGLPYQRRLLLSFYAFFACLALMGGLAAIALARGR
jgi:hypothetical protein